ncbi:uncharacterized protein B4U80_09151 [Leptotrombidium deliense]|uniref:Chitin-binding type-2 domain-containing protein n=1 Tax=Leptotrombidium deliense TaxID=299467 RepID=A0A443SVV3_9ACAR|nr:uncharacterized protein B4U80_09151 [Leptotrombidium deliense]
MNKIWALFVIFAFTNKLEIRADNASPSSNGTRSSDFACPEQFGYFEDALHESCAGGLYFSSELQTCDWPRNVLCSTGEFITTNRKL